MTITCEMKRTKKSKITELKRELTSLLHLHDIIDNDYNGQIVINISQGGVGTIQQNKHIS